MYVVSDPALQAVSIRLPRETIETLDAFAAAKSEANPGLKVTRSDAGRMLIEMGIAVNAKEQSK